MVTITFVAGTLVLHDVRRDTAWVPEACVWDDRIDCYRAPAVAYADVVRAITRAKVPFADEARRYEIFEQGARVMREPRPFQEEAVQAWRQHRCRGVVILPTGSGKTHVAMMAIHDRLRSTLVVAPTLDLVRQWYDQLRHAFVQGVGVIGGGDYNPQPITIITYDSAHLYMENLGNRFGLVIFDECHHLPGASYALAAKFCLAPFRLGLTATPERTDGKEEDLTHLIGPEVYQRSIVDLSGDYLAEYETERLVVELSPLDRQTYEKARGIYRTFLGLHGIQMSSPSGWKDFLIRASRSTEGRQALAAYRRQRQLALASSAKLDVVGELLHRHRTDRGILFTQDNATAYLVSRRFLIPIITHQTKIKERSEILEGLAKGVYNAVVTSKVLNEGVDVPDANVAIVISGSGSVREHVQRLGRVLRKKEGKQAILYELVSGGTGEAYTSERRREHIAYR